MTAQQDIKWVVLAIVIAPLAIVPAWLVFGVVDYFIAPVRWVYLKYHFQPFELWFGLPISYLLTLLVGLPAFLILRHYRMETLPIIMGVALITVTVSILLVAGTAENILGAVAFLSYYALWVAIAAWFIAVWIPRKRSNPALNTDAGVRGAG